MDFKKTGQFIQIRRKAKGLTQRQLAELLGISDKTISKWETGKSFPDFTYVSQMCQLLEINVNELLSGDVLSSKEYPEKAEANMIFLMEKMKHRRIKDVIYTIISVVLFVFVIFYLIWDVFAPNEWHLLNWFYEPVSLIAECLLLGAFWLMSIGIDEKKRFKLAEKFILSIGVVISLVPFELMLLGIEEISQLDALMMGTCLIPIFYAFCIYILLIYLEMIKERTNSRQKG